VTDETIFKSIKQGNKKAMEYLFDRYYESLFSFARKIVCDSDMAHESVQKVLIRLWDNSERIEIRSSLKSYLFASVKNECIQHLRSIKIRDNNNRLMTLAYFEAIDLNLSSENIDDLLIKLKPYIEKLPEQCRKIYMFRAYYGYKYSKIAKILGTTEDVVKVQMYRATRKLKILYSPDV
jgi:RNA polymerase sigma-70 factor (family 1)